MIDFAGWDMPVQYPTGILAEHLAVRSACGVFDLSHMGRVHLRGVDALSLAQQCCTRNLSKTRHGEAAYSVLCNPEGGILDDVIGYVLDEREIVFVFNASNRLSDIAWFTEQRDQHGWNVEIDDRTLETALIGIQGPLAQNVLQSVCRQRDLGELPGYAFVLIDVAGASAIVSRTGYTGEDGFEVTVPAAAAAHVWESLTEGATPCGLGARDTLRTEAGFALYGHDIDQSTNPFEARLGWIVDLSKERFMGKEALERVTTGGPSRRLVGLRVAAGGVPRPGIPIVQDHVDVGSVTSGTLSPTLKTNIAMGYVPVALSRIGQTLAVEIRGKSVPAEVVRLPFVAHRSVARATM
jgi:aminomethyltransferase